MTNFRVSVGGYVTEGRTPLGYIIHVDLENFQEAGIQDTKVSTPKRRSCSLLIIYYNGLATTARIYVIPPPGGGGLLNCINAQKSPRGFCILFVCSTVNARVYIYKFGVFFAISTFLYKIQH